MKSRTCGRRRRGFEPGRQWCRPWRIFAFHPRLWRHSLKIRPTQANNRATLAVVLWGMLPAWAAGQPGRSRRSMPSRSPISRLVGSFSAFPTAMIAASLSWGLSMRKPARGNDRLRPTASVGCTTSEPETLFARSLPRLLLPCLQQDGGRQVVAGVEWILLVQNQSTRRRLSKNWVRFAKSPLQ